VLISTVFLVSSYISGISLKNKKPKNAVNRTLEYKYKETKFVDSVTFYIPSLLLAFLHICLLYLHYQICLQYLQKIHLTKIFHLTAVFTSGCFSNIFTGILDTLIRMMNQIIGISSSDSHL